MEIIKESIQEIIFNDNFSEIEKVDKIQKIDLKEIKFTTYKIVQN